jgi:hypothetical protein
MAYSVVQRTPQGAVIATEHFDTLDEALEDAGSYAILKGSRPVEIAVIDEDGNEHFRQAFENANRT